MEQFHFSVTEHFRCLREGNKTFTPELLIKHAIFDYNSVYSVTKFISLEIVKGHINNPGAFDLNDHLVIPHYMQDHKKSVNESLIKTDQTHLIIRNIPPHIYENKSYKQATTNIQESLVKKQCS